VALSVHYRQSLKFPGEHRLSFSLTCQFLFVKS
jgi:hypothetical protein